MRVEHVDSERERDARVADRGIGIGELDAESEIDTRPVRAERELVQQVVTRTLGDLELTTERGELVTNVPVRPSELAEDEDGPGRESYATERCELRSPVPTHTTFGRFASTVTQPIEKAPWASKIGCHDAPPFRVFQTPPDAEPM